MSHIIDIKKEDRFSAPVPPPTTPQRKFAHFIRSRRKFFIALACALCAFWLLISLASGGEWRAVFLSNNQVYFGHFRYLPFVSTITLHDIYYLQVGQSLQPSSGNSGPELKLVKLGDEIHGPEDQMVIPKTQILFWEPLKPSSAVVKTIDQMKSQR